MKKRAYLFSGLMLLVALISAQVFLKYESNKLCDQLTKIRSGQREDFSAVFPLFFHEEFLCSFARDSNNPSRSMNALNLLGGMKSGKGRKIIKEYLTSDTPRVRAIAVDCLAYYSDDEMCRTLVGLLESEEDLKVYAMAGGVLVKNIELVELDDLKAIMDVAVSPVQKCILSGIIYAKEQNAERRDAYEKLKSGIGEDDASYIEFFEAYLIEKTKEDEASNPEVGAD